VLCVGFNSFGKDTRAEVIAPMAADTPQRDKERGVGAYSGTSPAPAPVTPPSPSPSLSESSVGPGGQFVGPAAAGSGAAGGTQPLLLPRTVPFPQDNLKSQARQQQQAQAQPQSQLQSQPQSSTAKPTEPEDKDKLVTLYRGGHADHPGLAEAKNGIARPQGGAATVDEHLGEITKVNILPRPL